MKYYELVIILNGKAITLFEFYSLAQASKSLADFARKFPNKDFFLVESCGKQIKRSLKRLDHNRKQTF